MQAHRMTSIFSQGWQSSICLSVGWTDYITIEHSLINLNYSTATNKSTKLSIPTDAHTGIHNSLIIHCLNNQLANIQI